ncbi:hypothetical protein [Canicola haemoglobinophilus]|uniref:hypothetical protein n=1 Tax=Canicola haemoglobinophilus TaxID=733 RepID=UPI0011799CF5|nr:hypothetical protein [Canicola haemoglobinophilus]
MKKILLLLFLDLFFNTLWAKEIRLFNRLELVLPQAEQGDKEAQFNVGVIYMLGVEYRNRSSTSGLLV